jgi:hypothetical protein
VFFAAVIGPEERLPRVHEALGFHGEHLRATGWSGEFDIESFAGGLIAWDGATSHGELLRSPADGTVILRGGYLAADDEWDDAGRHSTERDDVWGEFAAIVARPLAGDSTQLDAFSDPAASWPIYHGRRDDTLVVSNDPHLIGALLGLTRLSEQGVFELLAYQHSLGVETTISGIERLFPGDRLQVVATRGGLARMEIKRRPVYEYETGPSDAAELERLALDALRDGVSDIRPLAGGAFADATIQISGGLDSRLTAAVLADVFDERPPLVTFDLSNDFEMTVAKSVAERLGYPHRTATLAEADLDTMRVGWLLTGGQVSPYAAAGNVVSYQGVPLDSRGRALIVGAWPGDCLIGSYIPLRPGMTSSLLRRAIVSNWVAHRGHDRTGPGGGVSGPRARHVARAARRRLRRRILDGSGSSAAQSISFWAMFGRQPTFSYVHPAMLTSHVLPITPVLARPYLHHLLQLTGPQIIGKNFYRAMIAHGFPSLADVPNASTGKPVTDLPAVIRWRPTSVDDLYMRLPVVVRRLVHVTLGRLRTGSRSPELSVEDDHWSSVLSAGGHSDRVELDGIVVTAGPGSDIHLRSVARGLRWTVDHLDAAAARLGPW